MTVDADFHTWPGKSEPEVDGDRRRNGTDVVPAFLGNEPGTVLG